MAEPGDIQVGLTDADRDEREALQEEFKSDTRSCPQCGAPVDNLRATCSNCGRAYEPGEYDQEGAGRDLVAGALVDEQGNEKTSDEDLDRMTAD